MNDPIPSLLNHDDEERGVSGDRRRPVPMMPSEIIRIETAMYFANVGDRTIREWAKRYGIGRQADRHAPLQISLPALLMKVDGDTRTIDRLRSGDREHPAVVHYLERSIAMMEELRKPKQRRSQTGR